MESPTDIIVSAGQTVQIRCSAYGAPKPIITWIKNNVHITEANRYSFSPSGTLSIRDVGKADEGRYECAARNSIGAASAQMTLTVQSKIRSHNVFIKNFPVVSLHEKLTQLLQNWIDS